jgi:hypothetical protein
MARLNQTKSTYAELLNKPENYKHKQRYELQNTVWDSKKIRKVEKEEGDRHPWKDHNNAY